MHQCHRGTQASRPGRPDRIALRTTSPLAGWDARAVGPHSYVASGGYEYDGRKIANLDEEEIAELCRRMSGEVDAVAVCGVFAPVNREQEKRVGDIVREVMGSDMPVTYSSEIGGIGLLERENASVLNAALLQVIAGVVRGFEEALNGFGIDAKLYICQNDGTLMKSEYAPATRF